MSIIVSIISARTSSDASGRETGKGNQKGHLYYPTLPSPLCRVLLFYSLT